MPDEAYINEFMQKLIGGEQWLHDCLHNPRVRQHGADPWSIDVDIGGEPIIFSFKANRDESGLCINLRVREKAADFTARITQLYGAQFDAIEVGIAANGAQAYFKPFGTRNGHNTTDVYFNPLNVEQAAPVGRSHEMPSGGEISLRAAVIRVLTRLGLGPQGRETVPAVPVQSQAVAPAPAQPVVGDPEPQVPRERLVNQIMHFLHDHCTGSGEVGAENQKKFVTELAQLLEKNTLQSRKPEQLWELMWDKPIYANQNNNTATQVILRCRQNKVFDDLKKIPQDVPGQPIILGGLRHPAEKLERIRRLAQNFENIYRLYQSAMQTLQAPANVHFAQDSRAGNFDSVRTMIGALPQGGGHASLYQAVKNIPGFGDITTLHMLMDFGFPVCKPDLWIVRMVIAFLNVHNGNRPDLADFVRQQYPAFNPDGLDQQWLNRNHPCSFKVLDYIVMNELDFTDPFFAQNGIDPAPRFRGHRLADLMVAKFGMKPEARFGLVISPMERLNRDRGLQGRYPELARLAEQLR